MYRSEHFEMVSLVICHAGQSYLNLLILNHFCRCIYCLKKQAFFSFACSISGEQLLSPFTKFCLWYQKSSK